MNTILYILIVLGSIIVLLLVVAAFLKKEHYVKRDIVVNAPRQKVFDYIKLLKNQDEFNKNAMTAPDRERTFKGTDGTVGYVYAWKGNKDAGEGEKEITDIVEGKKIETEIRFVKPMRATATIIMEVESLRVPDGDNEQTKVSWSNAGKLPYPLNIMVPMLEKHVTRDMDSSLTLLKNILEK
jgi:hypothetical protein